VIRVPQELDLQIARWRLEAFGKKIDSLTKVQRQYAQSWQL
jgi:S-adenosylhomocysteine hydrolase